MLHLRFRITAELVTEKPGGKLEPLMSDEVSAKHTFDTNLVRISGPLNLYNALKATRIIPTVDYLDFINRLTRLLAIAADGKR